MGNGQHPTSVSLSWGFRAGMILWESFSSSRKVAKLMGVGRALKMPIALLHSVAP